MDVDGSRVWFTDLWNYSIIPYMLEAVREGLQVTFALFYSKIYLFPRYLLILTLTVKVTSHNIISP